MMKMKKIIPMLVFFVLVSFVSLAQEMTISVENIAIEPVIRVRVTENNPYYTAFGLEEDDFAPYYGYEMRITGPSGEVLYEGEAFEENSFPFIDKNITIEVLRENNLVSSETVNFCNFNDICEPCFSDNCNTAENLLTCDDCTSGTEDNFCDLERDGICDPDCDGVDGDCSSCERCYFKDSTCENSGGIVCDYGQDCIGGRFDSAFDDNLGVSTCCIGGKCGDLAEYLNTQKTIEFYPEEFEEPEYEVPTTSCAERGGRLCDVDQDCDGEWDFYIPSDPEAEEEERLCCLGSCITPIYDMTPDTSDDEMLTDAEIALALSNEPKNFSDPIIPKAAVLEANQFDEFLQEDIYTNLSEDEFPHELMATPPDEFPAPKEPEPTAVTEVIDFIDEQAGKVSLVSVVVILGILLLLIGGLIGIFRTIAKKKVPIVSGPDLQAEIDTLVSQGYDYKRIQSILVQKGNDKSHVTEEIRKDYQRRVALQQQKGPKSPQT